jgi:hypothetical protein
MENLFEHIYVNNIWGRNTESKSGPGSALSYTTNIRQEIGHLLSKADIKTFFDAPCGDFNWMKAVEFPKSVRYVGGDISPSLITDVTESYANDQRSFMVFNITTDVFPKADVWFCRHCFFHLPYKAILSALSLFATSEIPLLFASTDINVRASDNTNDIAVLARGGFRFLDLFAPPFELPRDVLFWAADCVYPDPRREMCVWTRQQVANALPAMWAKIMAS